MKFLLNQIHLLIINLSPKFSIVIILLLIGIVPVKAELINIDEPLSKNINLLMDLAERLKTNALNEGNYITSQKINTILLFLEDLQISFSKDLDKKLRKLDIQIAASLRELEKILNSTWHQIAQIEQDLDLIAQSAIQNLCDKFPALCNEAVVGRSISYVKGEIIPYTQIDEYEIEFNGIALQNNSAIVRLKVFKDSAVINAREVPISNYLKRNFIIERDELNSYFIDTACVSIKYELSISSPKMKKRFLFFNKKYNQLDTVRNSIMLLPKYPIKAQLIEVAERTDTITGPSYNKNKHLTITIPSRPGPYAYKYTYLSEEFKLDADEVFLNVELKSFHPNHKYYQGKVFLQDHWDCHYLGDLNLEHSLTNGGRLVSCKITNSLYSQGIHEHDIAAASVEFNNRFQCIGCGSLTGELKVNYGKLVDKKIDIPLNIKNNILGKLTYSTYYSDKIDSRFEDFKLSISPYYWNKVFDIVKLTQADPAFKSKFINVNARVVADQVKVEVVSK